MSEKINREIPCVRAPSGKRLTRTEAEAALALADTIIRWAASVDPVQWSDSREKWVAAAGNSTDNGVDN